MAAITGETPLAGLRLLNRGKVRDVYEVDDATLLFVASDRISAYDVIMTNGVPGKGKILTQLSLFWFELLGGVMPHHVITAEIDKMPASVQAHRDVIAGRCMLVRRLRILKIEAIVRGYLSGSGWKEYQKHGTVCGIPLPHDLGESQILPRPLFTPSTKADAGQHDENIHPDKAAEIIGKENAEAVAKAAVELYTRARDYAAARGIIIADTKFEFGVDEATGQVVLADEVLTPDSSRFWPAADYAVGRGQNSYDKQYVRDYLTSVNFDMKTGIALPDDVIARTLAKYVEVFKILTGKDPVL